MSKKQKPQRAEGRGQKKAAPKTAGAVRLSQHPRAKEQIRTAKGWAGLAGLVLAGYASWHGGLEPVDIALRALIGGIAAYMLVWFCAVQVWRHLAVAEVRAAEKVWQERKAEAERQAAQLRAEREAAMAGQRA